MFHRKLSISTLLTQHMSSQLQNCQGGCHSLADLQQCYSAASAVSRRHQEVSA